MNEVTLRGGHRAAVLCLSLLMLAVSAALGYVAHLTRDTAERLNGSQPSVLPLVGLALLAFIAGLSALRVAWHADAGEAV